jgi:hypothetical protein
MPEGATDTSVATDQEKKNCQQYLLSLSSGLGVTEGAGERLVFEGFENAMSLER